ncbi:MAG: late competence development ComFB family protein [Firmicutes bacterium]|nr:late competence development ComFB family protein [Bacillota bacterium]
MAVLQNFVVDVVERMVDNVLEERPEVCLCARCRQDMILRSLNHVKPDYINEEMLTVPLEDLDEEIFASVLSAVLESVEVVHKYPRHDKKDQVDLSPAYRNYSEDYLDIILTKALSEVDDVCTCDHCLYALKVSCLTEMEPRYFSSEKGRLFVKLAEMDNQLLCQTLVLVYRSFDQIRKSPAHLTPEQIKGFS